VDGVELVPMLGEVRERVALDEHVARVAGLGLDIEARDVEAGELVAASRPAGPAEQV